MMLLGRDGEMERSSVPSIFRCHFALTCASALSIGLRDIHSYDTPPRYVRASQTGSEGRFLQPSSR